MTQFEDREKAFENKFGLDEEMHFKVRVHAAKLFGSWAAGQMGLKDTEAETYATQAGEMAVTYSDREKLVKKIEQDLITKGVNFSHHRLERELNECEQAAQRQAA